MHYLAQGVMLDSSCLVSIPCLRVGVVLQKGDHGSYDVGSMINLKVLLLLETYKYILFMMSQGSSLRWHVLKPPLYLLVLMS